MSVCVRTNLVVFREYVVWWLVCRVNRRQTEVCFSPDIILCGWLGSKHQLTHSSDVKPVHALAQKSFIVITRQLWSCCRCSSRSVITAAKIEICFQPWYNPLWLTGVKAPADSHFWCKTCSHVDKQVICSCLSLDSSEIVASVLCGLLSLLPRCLMTCVQSKQEPDWSLF